MDILLPAERIQQRVDELARQIAADFHGRPTTIVSVLTVCLMFLSETVEAIKALPVRDLADDNEAHLWLWATNRRNETGVASSRRLEQPL